MAAKTIKISEELLAAIGANESDFEQKVQALFKDSGALKAENTEIGAKLTALVARIDAIDAKLTALEARKLEVTEADRNKIIDLAKTEAKTTASSEVATAIAKVGVQSVAGGTQSQDKPDFKALVDAELKANPKLTKTEAIVAAAEKAPAVYEDWKKNGGKL